MENRTCIVNFRCEHADMKLWKAKARDEGLNISGVIRQLLIQKYGKSSWLNVEQPKGTQS